MFDTKEDKISTIKSLMQNHKTLHQGFFGADEKLLPYVYAKFCEMINFVQNNYVSFLQNVEIEDIVLTGSLCGYV